MGVLFGTFFLFVALTIRGALLPPIPILNLNSKLGRTMRATIEVHHFFSGVSSALEASHLSLKADRIKI